MELKEFLACYREAFGENAQLPLLFGYSDTLATIKTNSDQLRGLL